MSAAKAVSGLVVLVALLGGGAVLGDRYAEGRAEEYAQQVISDNISVTQTPTVDIQGFPFLTQVISGTLEEVTGSVAGATLGGVPATDVQLDAHDVLVRPPPGDEPRAGRVTVAATIPTSSLEKVVRDRSGLTVSLAVEGSRLEASGKVLGLPLLLGLVPRVENGTLLVDVQTIALGGRPVTPESLPTMVRDRLSGVEIPVEGLPERLGLTGAVVVPGGVRITTAGTDVRLSQPSAASG